MKTKSIFELKALAREHLIGNYGIAIGFFVRFMLLYFILTLFYSSTPNYSNFAGFFLSIILYTLLLTLLFMVKAGLCSAFMKINCEIKPSMSDLYYGFLNNPKRTFLCGLFFAGLEVLLTIIPAETLSITAPGQGITYMLKLLAISLIGFIIYTYISICFSQVFYLMNDFPDKSVKELFILSNWLMKGQKLKYFFFLLSFIPIYILGILSLFIGFIWISPYQLSAKACYYLDLVKSKTAK